MFYTGGHEGCHVGGLSELCHICVTDIWKWLKLFLETGSVSIKAEQKAGMRRYYSVGLVR